jgi:starch synthase (maltosyl-transferring)
MEKLSMQPAPGQHALKFVGDRITFTLAGPNEQPLPAGWRAFLRTNVGRGRVLRHEIIHAHTGQLALRNAAWHDLPMEVLAHGHRADGHAGDNLLTSIATGARQGVWTRDLTLAEVGYFQAKAYAVDESGRQHWPHGPNAGICVHPDAFRTANTIYCAFPRMFGASRTAASTESEQLNHLLQTLDKDGFTVIPPSGKLRDLTRQLAHIFDVLGCRILHLLPVSPTPTTFAKFGRFGSPYAVQDLAAIDPALVEFDKRTTGIDQFRELTYAVHARGGRVLLDVVANHTGWGSRLFEEHPEWFVRSEKGQFVSPGAWGVTWEDLVELDHRNPALWETLADVFLTWCRRGVDGFRCDAGYKIPVPAWRYITARVQEDYPETMFLLEGLGGSWEATENLLKEGGMQWAYSELFQNYSGREVAWYLDYAVRQSERVGVYVNYSETHDNNRLAAKGGSVKAGGSALALSNEGRQWSLLRNRLCALASVNGAFGFTGGVEWLATEKVNVHSSRGMSWGSPDNIVEDLAELNKLLATHPSFFDGARLTRLSPDEDAVFALARVSWDGLDQLLVLVNNDTDKPASILLSRRKFKELGEPMFDLLTRRAVRTEYPDDLQVKFTLRPAECLCLSALGTPRGLSGNAYREKRAQAAWAISALTHVLPAEAVGVYEWEAVADLVNTDPYRFLSLLSRLDVQSARTNSLDAIGRAGTVQAWPNVIRWNALSARRITLVPPNHWLLVQDETPFRAVLGIGGKTIHVCSIQVREGHVACFGPNMTFGDGTLLVERYGADPLNITAPLRYLPAVPDLGLLEYDRTRRAPMPQIDRELGLALLTNGIGGMARLDVDLGEARSKYDCALGANLHPRVPVDRHIFAKRIRVWVVADGFMSPLKRESLASFAPGPPARWRFMPSAGDGRSLEINLAADMLEGRNTTVFRFTRPGDPPAFGKELPVRSDVRLIVRVDIADRNFHWETHRNEGAEHHFTMHSRTLSDRVGFEFSPAPDRRLRVLADGGVYHPEIEWSMGVFHPVEASRGQTAHEDSFSPGWFELPLDKDGSATLTLTADATDPAPAELASFERTREVRVQNAWQRAGAAPVDTFGRQLAAAIQPFVVRRDLGKTVIAGYPWFLDWGRDSLICARGLLAAGLVEEVRDLLIVYGHFEKDGTLPNQIMGEDVSNRSTSDAPLWFGVVCHELAEIVGPDIYATKVDSAGRTLADVLGNIARFYSTGTANGIVMDPASALIWSPCHYTWMDTNFPAGTPREGYPVEIQILWILLLRQVEKLGAFGAGGAWADLAERATESLHKYFWLAEREFAVARENADEVAVAPRSKENSDGFAPAYYLADVLRAGRSVAAADGQADTALRSNYLWAISFGIMQGIEAQQAVHTAENYLVVPGALRTLAPLPVDPPLPIHGADGGLLNDPVFPYCGRYEGDEDTKRKPAYHNGAAWTWTFPTFCEALARAWQFSPEAVAAAKAYLGSMDRLFTEGCIGQLPEIVDGDSPHTQRGCDAQAWGVTEAYRVWKLLRSSSSK